MAQMYKIMLRCPSTQQVLDTGIRTSGRDALISNIYRPGRTSCRHCGQVHPFEGNAFVEPDEGQLESDLWRPNP